MLYQSELSLCIFSFKVQVKVRERGRLLRNKCLAVAVWVLVDVGRSCILVSMGGKNVMLDCGMHMGFNDEVCSLLIIY